MVLEAVIAGPDVEIDGIAIAADAVTCSLPVPLLREHCGEPIGEVYDLLHTSRGLVAVIETDHPTDDYTHVSPTLRVHDTKRMRLLEVSLVQQSVSPHTTILRRTPSDPAREYARCLAERSDLMIRRIGLLQRLLPVIARQLEPTP
ncbi:hypothetical protein JQ543_05500 [Bradyrhizobium diazoefficiens]|nr:hypothetical protein [Bradyrhizobium diazoefficiens]MBR0847197.1 hypothetical protein [Bradyrhizobium diazoefficiens]